MGVWGDSQLFWGGTGNVDIVVVGGEVAAVAESSEQWRGPFRECIGREPVHEEMFRPRQGALGQGRAPLRWLLGRRPSGGPSARARGAGAGVGRPCRGQRRPPRGPSARARGAGGAVGRPCGGGRARGGSGGGGK